MKIGIVGAGAMGSIIARAIDRGEVNAVLAAIADLDGGRAEALRSSLEHPPVIRDAAGVAAEADLVVEAAGAAAVAEILRLAAERRRDVVILSVGGLIENEALVQRAQSAGVTIHCPSGAIAGIDAVKAASVGRIECARITTRKPPAGLAGAPHLVREGIDLSGLDAPRVVFEGSAREACRAFPANVNVAAALSLAGIGVDRTEVRVVADPGVTRNVHTIEVIGDFGRLETTTENAPSENPKTSRLAALSAIALLRGLTAPLRIGT